MVMFAHLHTNVSLGVRVRRFKNTTGALSWNGRHAGLHPDACECNIKDDAYPGTPHTHYDNPPYKCARCDCPGYTPIRPDLSSLDGLRILG